LNLLLAEKNKFCKKYLKKKKKIKTNAKSSIGIRVY